LPHIFISYRRDDAAGHAGRLYDDLVRKFGADHVFMDVAAIDPGADFVETIGAAVGSCDVLLAVIGLRWAPSVEAQRRRRLNSPQDFVHIEIESALERKVRVIPVLVQGARMPTARMLPEPLVPFTRRQAHELSDARWRYDVNNLIERLEQMPTGPGRVDGAAPGPRADPVDPVEATGATTRIATPKHRDGKSRVPIGLLGAAVGLIGLVALVTGIALAIYGRNVTPSPPIAAAATQPAATTAPTVVPTRGVVVAGAQATGLPTRTSVPTATLAAKPTATAPVVVPTATVVPTVAPSATPLPRSPTPEEWVRAYYNAINERRFNDAYAIFSVDAQRHQTEEDFQAQFKDLINITVRYVDGVSQPGARVASLVAHTTTVYRVTSGPSTNCWTVTWNLLLEDNLWKRDSLSQQPENSCDTHP
jgi:TIR domain